MRLTVSVIISVVAKHFGYEAAALMGAGKGRKQRVSRARHVVCYAAKRMTSASYPLIAARMDMTNHTSAIYGDRAVARLIETHPAFAVLVSAIIEDLKEMQASDQDQRVCGTQ